LRYAPADHDVDNDEAHAPVPLSTEEHSGSSFNMLSESLHLQKTTTAHTPLSKKEISIFIRTIAGC
jgi:hypothetical protein